MILGKQGNNNSYFLFFSFQCLEDFGEFNKIYIKFNFENKVIDFLVLIKQGFRENNNKRFFFFVIKVINYQQ